MFGENALGTTNRGTPLLSTFTITVACDVHPKLLPPVTVYNVVVSAFEISNKPLSSDFISSFDQANEFGVSNIEKVLPELNYNGSVNLAEYFNKYISYTLNDEKRKALKKFLGFLNKDVTVQV